MKDDFTYGILIGAMLALAAVCLAAAAACGGISIYQRVTASTAQTEQQEPAAPVAATPLPAADGKENF